MTRPTYLADEVRARLAEYEVLRARCAALEGAGEAFLMQIGYGRKVHRGRGEEVVHEVNGIAVQAFRAALSSPATATPDAPRCERCGGTGVNRRTGWPDEPCPACGGTGWDHRSVASFKCPACGGSGKQGGGQRCDTAP